MQFNYEHINKLIWICQFIELLNGNFDQSLKLIFKSKTSISNRAESIDPFYVYLYKTLSLETRLDMKIIKEWYVYVLICP